MLAFFIPHMLIKHFAFVGVSDRPSNNADKKMIQLGRGKRIQGER
jgi:hypothetical protein